MTIYESFFIIIVFKIILIQCNNIIREYSSRNTTFSYTIKNNKD